MKNQNKIHPILEIGLVVLSSSIIGLISFGCKKDKPISKNIPPIESTEQKTSKEDFLSDDKLYKQTKIAFESYRDGNPEIYVMNVDGSEQKNLTKNPAYDTSPLWSPDGKKIAFMSDRDGYSEIYVMNADGSEQKKLTEHHSDVGSSWSPDGKKITFHSERDGNYEIYVMNSDGSEQKRLTNNPALDLGPSWSPDGKKIAFTSDRDGNDEIYVMNADGSGLKNLTVNPASDVSLCWSPDGKKMAFYSDRDGNAEIYVMNADGSVLERLTNNSADDINPSWSPDGKKIAFKSERDGNDDIYIMSADGSQQRSLANNPFFEGVPSWSPDGKKIALVSYRLESNGHENYEIYVMNADGSEQKNLTNNPAEDTHPCWSPFLVEESKVVQGQKVVAEGGSQPEPVTSNIPAKEPDAAQDKRAISLSKLRMLEFTEELYAMDNDGNFPDTFEQMYPYHHDSKLLESPLKPKDFKGSSYILVQGHSIKENRFRDEDITIYENPEYCTDTINVVFRDGHAESLPKEKYLKTLEETYKRLGREMPSIKFGN